MTPARLPEDFEDPTQLAAIYAVRVARGETEAERFLVQACDGDLVRAGLCVRWAARIVAADRTRQRALGEWR